MGDMGMTTPSLSFWEGRRVLVTGHTGFKGSWLSCWLNQLKAEIYGYSLAPDADPNLYECLALSYAGEKLGDLRDQDQISEYTKTVRPEFVFHLAAQPLVRRSYRDPIETFSTNVMGTANLLQALRDIDSVKAVLVVTSDKAYDNTADSGEYKTGRFSETDRLGGADPYSASKSAQEIVTRSFSESYFREKDVPVATARAGNVIGGGDWSEDRLITDILCAAEKGTPIRLRHPTATRPWQHVLEPLAGYLLYVEALAAGKTRDTALNFGPSQSYKVVEVVEKVLALCPKNSGWVLEKSKESESQTLELDPTRALSILGWKTRLTIDEAVSMVVKWHRNQREYDGAATTTLKQIHTYQDILKRP